MNCCFKILLTFFQKMCKDEAISLCVLPLELLSKFIIHEYVHNFDNKRKNNNSQNAEYETLKLNENHP